MHMLYHKLSRDQLIWLVENQVTLKFKKTNKGILVKIACHGHAESVVCLHNHAPDTETIRDAVNQLITTINFFL